MPAALLSRAAAEGLARSVGHEAGVTWVAGGVRLPCGPRVAAVFFRQVTASLTLLDHSLLHASFDRVHENISLFAAILVCGMPGGSRAMPSPHQGTLACPKPGTPGDFSPARDESA